MAAVPLLDALIIGGGPAGLAAATSLARQLYTGVVFDSGLYRNARTKHMHNVPTWDHRDPAEFRAKARDDLLARYSTIEFENTNLVTVRKTPEGRFEAVDTSGKTWTGKKVVLAVGVRDVYPEIKGYGDVWARGVYHCLFCHGYEERGAPSAGVLAFGPWMGAAMPVLHIARMAKRLAEKVTIYTHGDEKLSNEIVTALGSDTFFTIDTRKLTRFEKGTDTESEVILHLEDGTRVSHGFVAHRPASEINGPFAEQLGLELTSQGVIKTEGPMHETSVKGVFAAGDCASVIPAVVIAMGMGSFAAVGLVGQLQQDPGEPPKL